MFSRFRASLFTRVCHDKFGNGVTIESFSKCYYYQSGETYGIDISSLVPGNLRCNEAPTPYGFALFAHSSDMFYASSGETLIFIQPQEA